VNRKILLVSLGMVALVAVVVGAATVAYPKKILRGAPAAIGGAALVGEGADRELVVLEHRLSKDRYATWVEHRLSFFDPQSGALRRRGILGLREKAFATLAMLGAGDRLWFWGDQVELELRDRAGRPIATRAELEARLLQIARPWSDFGLADDGTLGVVGVDGKEWSVRPDSLEATAATRVPRGRPRALERVGQWVLPDGPRFFVETAPKTYGLRRGAEPLGSLVLQTTGGAPEFAVTGLQRPLVFPGPSSALVEYGPAPGRVAYARVGADGARAWVRELPAPDWALSRFFLAGDEVLVVRGPRLIRLRASDGEVLLDAGL